MEKIKRTLPDSMKRRHPFLKAMGITFGCFALILVGYFLADGIDSMIHYFRFFL